MTPHVRSPSPPRTHTQHWEEGPLPKARSLIGPARRASCRKRAPPADTASQQLTRAYVHVMSASARGARRARRNAAGPSRARLTLRETRESGRDTVETEQEPQGSMRAAHGVRRALPNCQQMPEAEEFYSRQTTTLRGKDRCSILP